MILKYGGVVLVSIALLYGAYNMGSKHTQTKWDLAMSQMETAHQMEVSRLSALKNKVEIQYRDRIVEVEKVGETIIKEVPIYITEADDANCSISRSFVELHDAAAEGRLPDPAAPAEFAAGAAKPRLSDVGRGVAGNYNKFHGMKAQCQSLIDWAKDLKRQ
jgi:hypothetical protein